MPKPAPLVGSHAVISGCGRYRYTLERRWTPGPLLPWVMLNPSTADAATDDATIRRCTGYTRREGFAGLYVVNLYALRATDPAELKTAADPVGPENDDWLRATAEYARVWHVPIVVAWGAHADARRVYRARRTFEQNRLLCLGVNLGGSPRHPARLHTDEPLVPWT